MKPIKVKILGTGKYLPKQAVTAQELDIKLGCSPGWVAKKSGVDVRYFVTDETASYMGAQAVTDAVAAAGLTMKDIDCIVCASAIFEQPIPATAVLIQRELGLQWSGIPSFDINATCLSFLVGLDTMSCLIAAGKYRHVVLVSTEVASAGINWEQLESSILFGDGAAAVVLGPSNDGEASGILSSRIETYSAGADFSEIRGGGTRFPPRHYNERTRSEYLFDMDGHKIFKMVSKLLPDFMERLMGPTQSRIKDFHRVIPHQGSAMAMRLLQKKLGITDTQLLNIIADYGNTISASIPLALHEGISRGEIHRGDRLAIIGMAAGVSLGGMILDY
ncbi:beta-ketoacyl-ACP synthase III [Paenibacillus oenotherae]|uniref:Beta-ketoacyl-ACP synthase III n=1 Tax=Paenibacillus oenotherae TaxID=1435645 RepID=A0ABS7DCI1_9BACL|nr:beta-ketoacyl-ACP synthase III [Paenibacillus oenotherae]MBW7477207.1 beta-ketoacyl-ACP synthase III [Paenibacillus oenotherae]